MYGQTPLFYAASENKLALLDFFDNKGMPLDNVDAVNHVDKLASQTALYYAARKGNTEFCRRLIEKGANPAHLDNQNKTAADYAKKSRHI
jgi:ankyrin repeat protein